MQSYSFKVLKLRQARALNAMSWPLLNAPFERGEQKTTMEALGCTSPAREQSHAYSRSIELPVSPGKGPKTRLLPQIYYRSMALLTAMALCSVVALHNGFLCQISAGRSSQADGRLHRECFTLASCP